MSIKVNPWNLIIALAGYVLGVYWFGWWFLLPAIMVAIYFD